VILGKLSQFPAKCPKDQRKKLIVKHESKQNSEANGVSPDYDYEMIRTVVLKKSSRPHGDRMMKPIGCFKCLIFIFMRASHVVSAQRVVAISSLEHVSTAVKLCLEVVGYCYVNTSAQSDLPSGQV
jgi:hypothetical protein